jgi:3',5'-cyclic AMP phosphodiesterase CpdA
VNFQYTFLFLFILLFKGCSDKLPDNISSESGKVSVAFMADVHFHDVFAEFDDDSFGGLPADVNGKLRYATIRTMESQLTSTRLFNENYFAFRAALDDVVRRGIKYVAFPGDFSDDGQPIHVRGFRSVLNEYHDKYGIEFFIITGNHDPGRPFSTPAGKFSYLGEDGKRQPVFSHEHPMCNSRNQRGIETEQSHEVICTDEVMHYGYKELLAELGYFGMSPKEDYYYFETPFSTYSTENYDFDTARKESSPENRMYEICREGTGGISREDHYTHCFDIMDMSYLVEPQQGLWLLAIDANVYIPQENADTQFPEHPQNFSSPGNAGFNAVVTHKSHLIHWIEDVAGRAEKLGKHLVAFSHYPAADFYNGAGDEIRELWGHGRFQTLRLPEKEVSKILANTGLMYHVGGHMHMNDTGVVNDVSTGRMLFNIQTPSIAGYVPAYKVMHFFNDDNNVEVETVILENVPGFNTLFSLYQMEWDFLNQVGYDGIWNPDVLTSATYYEFSDWHLRELSRLRFLPREWPDSVREKLETMNGRELLAAALPEEGSKAAEITEFINSEYGLSPDDFETWDGEDFTVDFYRIRNAGSLAFRDIPEERLQQYAILYDVLHNFGSMDIDDDNLFRKQFGLLFSVLKKYATGYADFHFLINTDDGNIQSLHEIKNPFEKLPQ